jgi:hypothetical protein
MRTISAGFGGFGMVDAKTTVEVAWWCKKYIAKTSRIQNKKKTLPRKLSTAFTSNQLFYKPLQASAAVQGLMGHRFTHSAANGLALVRVFFAVLIPKVTNYRNKQIRNHK